MLWVRAPKPPGFARRKRATEDGCGGHVVNVLVLCVLKIPKTTLANPILLLQDSATDDLFLETVAVSVLLCDAAENGFKR